MVSNFRSKQHCVTPSLTTFLLLAVTLALPAAQAANASLHIGVAANFRPVIENLAQQYEQQMIEDDQRDGSDGGHSNFAAIVE